MEIPTQLSDTPGRLLVLLEHARSYLHKGLLCAHSLYHGDFMPHDAHYTSGTSGLEAE